MESSRMELSREDFIAAYRRLSTERLLEIKNEGGLIPIASEILERELQDRGSDKRITNNEVIQTSQVPLSHWTIRRLFGLLLLGLSTYIFLYTPIGFRQISGTKIDVPCGQKCDKLFCWEEGTLPVHYSSGRVLYFCPKHVGSAPRTITSGHVSGIGDIIAFPLFLLGVLAIVSAPIGLVALPLWLIFGRDPEESYPKILKTFCKMLMWFSSFILLPWIGSFLLANIHFVQRF